MSFFLVSDMVLLFLFIYVFCIALEEQLASAQQHVEQYKAISQASESALAELNQVCWCVVWSTCVMPVSLDCSDVSLRCCLSSTTVVVCNVSWQELFP